MRFNTFGKKENKIIIMLSGSFCSGKSMEYLYNELKNNYYIIVPEYNGHFENSTFTTRENEARKIVDYLKQNDIDSIGMIYGQSMGAEIGIELLYQLLKKDVKVEKAFFDGAPCIKLSYLYKKFMYLKFRTLVKMLEGKDINEILSWKFLNSFTNGDSESLRPLIEPITEIAHLLSKQTISNETECCYTFDFPEIEEDMQRNMYFFYAKEEKAYKTCINGVKKAYPNSNYEVVEGYGHLTYSIKNKEDYLGKIKKLLK